MVLSGSQWLPVVISGSQWLPVVLNGYQWFSVYQWLPVVLNGYQWFSVDPYPQSNLNVHTGICSTFAVPTSPGIYVLKLVYM